MVTLRFDGYEMRANRHFSPPRMPFDKLTALSNVEGQGSQSVFGYELKAAWGTATGRSGRWTVKLFERLLSTRFARNDKPESIPTSLRGANAVSDAAILRYKQVRQSYGSTNPIAQDCFAEFILPALSPRAEGGECERTRNDKAKSSEKAETARKKAQEKEISCVSSEYPEHPHVTM